jgi:hypothetical protein
MVAAERFWNTYFQNPDYEPIVLIMRTDDGRHWEALKNCVAKTVSDLKDIEADGGFPVYTSGGTTPLVTRSLNEMLHSLGGAGWQCPAFVRSPDGTLKAVQIPGVPANRFLEQSVDAHPAFGR